MSFRSLLFLSTLALASIAAHAQSGVSFTSIPLGLLATDLTYSSNLAPATVDFNGDGFPDYVGRAIGSNTTLSIVLRNPLGGFQAPVNLAFPSPNGGSIYQQFWGDFNRDGRPDVILKYTSSTPSGGIWLSTAEGSITFAGSVSLGALENLMGVADFNGDGISDLVTIDYNRPIGVDENAFYVYQSTGVGTYAPRQLLHLATGSAFIADVNGDGKKDIALFKITKKTDRNSVRIFTNTGSGFKDNGDIKIGSSVVTGVADLTGDGKADFFGYYGLILRTDSPTKLTQLNPLQTVLFSNNRFYVGDFNGDGRTDYLETGVQLNGTYAYTLYAAMPGGTVLPTTRSVNLGDYGNGLNSTAFALDYNGDGKTDLVRFTFDPVTFLTNSTFLKANTP